MVERDDLSFSAQEGYVQGLPHPVHVYGLAGIEQHPFTGLEGRSPQKALQARPHRIRENDATSEVDVGPGDVAHGHLLH
jgi:hypothetical protein